MCTNQGQQPPSSKTDSSGVPGLPFIVTAAVAITSALMAYLLDATTSIDINRGAYAIAVSVFVVGACGWIARCTESRLRRHVDTRMEEYAQRVEKAIRDTPASVSYLPHRPVQDNQPYRAVAVVGGQGDTVPLPTGLDPATLAAMRSINKRLTTEGQEN